LRRTTVIIPAAEGNWEVWSCTPGQECVWQGSAEDPKSASSGKRRVVVALPARACRTLSFRAPTQDRQLARQLAYAQLEKRGLATGSIEGTAFDCHVQPAGPEKSLVSIDVVTPGAAAPWESMRARGLMAFPRLFQLPAGKLVIIEEQGRLVLCAGANGRLVYSQVISTTRDLNGHAAPEINIASLALEQQGLVPAISGVELWGGFSAADAEMLSAQVGVPVVARPRPAPTAQAVERAASPNLLPEAAREELRHRRRRKLRWIAPVAAAGLVAAWAAREHGKLIALEREAARMEAAVPVTSTAASRLKADQDRVRAAQERWSALRLALDAKRYPLSILNGLTRCIPAGGVVLSRFESKVSEVTVTGTARSASEAYTYFNAVRQDADLGVYSWSMVEPGIAADATATFQIKGQMR
jgi:hypothetical protein